MLYLAIATLCAWSIQIAIKSVLYFPKAKQTIIRSIVFMSQMVNTHARTHERKHTYTHTHTHARTHARTHAKRFPSCTSEVLTKVKAKMIDVNVLITFWQFFRIKCTFVFCLSFLNETGKKDKKKFA